MIRRMFRNYCLDIGYFVKASSSKGEVEQFVRSLRPYQTGHDLIRLGTHSDGGYLVPDDLIGIDGLFSPGVNDNSDFEYQVADQLDIPCYMVDYSVDGPARQHKRFYFDKKFLGSMDRDIYWSLDSWVSRYAQNCNNLLLQIDIEGAEFEAIIASSRETLSKFRIIVAEIHGIDSIFNRYGLKLFQMCFEKLLQDFHVVHLHPNNCEGEVTKWGMKIPRVMEMTFIRKDRVSDLVPAKLFPHPLDCHCVPENDFIELDQCWYGAN